MTPQPGFGGLFFKLLMPFLKWLVTDLKKKTHKKELEFSCFPGKSHNV